MKQVVHVECTEDKNAPILVREDLAKGPFERPKHRWEELNVKWDGTVWIECIRLQTQIVMGSYQQSADRSPTLCKGWGFD